MLVDALLGMYLSQQFSLDRGVRDRGDLAHEDLNSGDWALATESGDACGQS